MNGDQAAELARLTKYWRKRQATAEKFHEDELGVWVKVTNQTGEELTTHLISPAGETTIPDDGLGPYL